MSGRTSQGVFWCGGGGGGGYGGALRGLVCFLCLGFGCVVGVFGVGGGGGFYDNLKQRCNSRGEIQNEDRWDNFILLVGVRMKAETTNTTESFKRGASLIKGLLGPQRANCKCGELGGSHRKINER